MVMKKFCLALLMVLAAGSAHALPPDDPARINEVIERGKHVMPFDLEKTQHIFDKTDSGGIQQVIAKDAGDTRQITLIRQHLSGLAVRFSQGDFSGPKRIHGDDMPGVAELGSAAGQVRFNYQDLPNGGQIVYQSEAPKLIDAIHLYFDAQLHDHARHAVGGGHAQHHAQ